MTVDELREALMYMDSDAEVLLTDGVHFLRRFAIDRMETDNANSVHKVPPVVLVAKEPPEVPWWDEAHREEHGY
jgi:hypothetical protein